MKINTGLRALLGVCGLLLGAGCDTINRSQYQVLGPARADGVRLAVTSEQQEAVRDVLQSVAKDLRFQERTDRSLVPNTIASYGEMDNLNPITFIAYVKQDTILIDILHSPTEVGESLRYRKVRDAILSGLNQRLPAGTVKIPDRRAPSKNTASTPEGTKPGSNISQTDLPTRPSK
jgi:hypothetical protein